MTDKPLMSTIRYLVNALTNFDVQNPRNLPSSGGILLTTNHISRLDTPLLIGSTDRKDIVAIVAKKYQKKPFFKWVLERMGTLVWMDRERMDFSAIREALSYLRKGFVVGIAPEGTRSHGAKGLLEGKQGAALLAARAAVPIIPVCIIGSDRIYQNWMRFRRPPITIKFGKPYYLPEIDLNDRQAWLMRCTEEIMCRIAALLPTEYRGFYADHPRVKELLGDWES